jgi:hypothetical protein
VASLFDGIISKEMETYIIMYVLLCQLIQNCGEIYLAYEKRVLVVTILIERNFFYEVSQFSYFNCVLDLFVYLLGVKRRFTHYRYHVFQN